MKAETVMAISAGAIRGEGLHEAFVMERLGITSWTDYLGTPQEILAYRLALKDTFDEIADAQRRAAGGGR